jgi:hypothetical protein
MTDDLVCVPRNLAVVVLGDTCVHLGKGLQVSVSIITGNFGWLSTLFSAVFDDTVGA